MTLILSRQDVSAVTFLLEIEHPRLAAAARPGQFVLVMVHEGGERIPLTIADRDLARGSFTLAVQAVGRTTHQLRTDAVPGTDLHAVAGPLGAPTELGDPATLVCVGGGLGVAPVFPHMKAHAERGATVIAVLGFRTAADVFWADRFARHADQVVLCTDDGSAGRPGLVTDGLRDVLAEWGAVDHVLAIGPPPMMRACAEVTRPAAVPTTVSLNPLMVDGTGMCGGCRVTVGGETRFACIDGPDFDGHRVDFDELAVRLRRFREDEARALATWQTRAAGAGPESVVAGAEAVA